MNDQITATPAFYAQRTRKEEIEHTNSWTTFDPCSHEPIGVRVAIVTQFETPPENPQPPHPLLTKVKPIRTTQLTAHHYLHLFRFRRE